MSFENTRIFRILSSMDAVTLNRFAKFIHSPYFNKNQKITSLFDITHNDIKKGNAVRSKDKLWTMVGFADGYKDIKFRKLCNDLVALYEEFLTVEQLLGDEMLKSNLLINGIKQNDNQILIEKHISKSSNIFDRNPDRSSDYYLHKYLNEKTLQNLKTNYEKKEDIKNYINEEVNKELANQLDAFYIIEKLRHAIDLITLSKQYKTNFQIDLQETERLINTSKELSSLPAIRIYYLIYQILTIEESQELFFELKELAKKNIYLFTKTEQAEIFDALFSYCIKWVNKDNLDFHLEYMDIHDWGIKEEYILKNGILSPISFRNYVVICLRVSDFERIENYIEVNSQLLEESRRENALNFNLARVNWYKKEYEDVLYHLNMVNYDDVWYNLNSKILLLATYYELDEIDPLYSALDSFSVYLRREKSLNQRKKRYLNFISYLKKLVNNPDSKSKMQSLKDKLIDDNEVVNKSWLLEKIEDLL